MVSLLRCDAMTFFVIYEDKNSIGINISVFFGYKKYLSEVIDNKYTTCYNIIVCQ